MFWRQLYYLGKTGTGPRETVEPTGTSHIPALCQHLKKITSSLKPLNLKDCFLSSILFMLCSKICYRSSAHMSAEIFERLFSWLLPLLVDMPNWWQIGELDLSNNYSILTEHWTLLNRSNCWLCFYPALTLYFSTGVTIALCLDIEWGNWVFPVNVVDSLTYFVAFLLKLISLNPVLIYSYSAFCTHFDSPFNCLLQNSICKLGPGCTHHGT